MSFRSTASVLKAVDAVFAQSRAAAGLSLDDQRVHHEIERVGAGGLVELWPIIEPRQQDDPAPWTMPAQRLEEDSPPARAARMLAQTIAGWIGKEMLESQGRPIKARDILILVRRRNIFVDLIVRELKKAGVDVAGVDRMVLADQLAIMDLVALGRFLLLPEDDLTLATVLKGPLFELSEENLFDLAHHRADRRLWAELRRRGEEPAFREAATTLSELLARVDYVRPYDLFAEVLGPRGGRRRILRRLGVEANDPLDEFLAACLLFERGHAPALETFLHWLEIGREEIKRDLEGHVRDEVRVMTVHGAKGLQAPVVILPDTCRVPQHPAKLLWAAGVAQDEPDLLLWSPDRGRDDPVAGRARARHAASQDAEHRRLLYVAMTRAQDRLYVCGYREDKQVRDDSWYRLIEEGLRNVADKFEFAGVDGDGAGQGLRLRNPQNAIVKPAQADAAAAETKLPEWWTRPPPDEPDPPRRLAPSRPDGDEPPVQGPFGRDLDTQRFHRGRLIHRLLEILPELSPSERDAAAQRFLARPGHRLDAGAQDEIRAVTFATLDAPEWSALFGPGSVAEAPIVGRVGARLVSGQLDRLLVTDDAVLAVDYKTNRPAPLKVEDTPPIYVRQMAAYRALLQSLYPQRRVRCAILWTDGPRLAELPESLISRYPIEK